MKPTPQLKLRRAKLEAASILKRHALICQVVQSSSKAYEGSSYLKNLKKKSTGGQFYLGNANYRIIICKGPCDEMDL